MHVSHSVIASYSVFILMSLCGILKLGLIRPRFILQSREYKGTRFVMVVEEHTVSYE
jgi:hypothetical protein